MKTIVYDPYSPDIRENPYAVYRYLRDEAPLYQHPDKGFFVVSRFADVLETRDDLARMLADLEARRAATGRTDPLDVMFMAFDPSLPGSDSWDAGAHRDEVQANADLGATWHQITPSGTSASEVLDVVRRYADDVVSQMS